MKYKLIDITKPVNGRVVYTDAYWLCSDSNPEKALFYGDSPQCNQRKEIMDLMLKGDRKQFPDLNVGIVYVPIAFVIRRRE